MSMPYGLYNCQGMKASDTIVHTWDVARAISADDTLSAGLVAWASDHLREIYDGLTETPLAPGGTHRFFAAPGGEPLAGASRQHRPLHLMGAAPLRVLASRTPTVR